MKRQQRKRRRNCRPVIQTLETRIAPLNMLGFGIGAGLLADLYSLDAADELTGDELTGLERPIARHTQVSSSITRPLVAGSQVRPQNQSPAKSTSVRQPQPNSSDRIGAAASRRLESVSAAQMVDRILADNIQRESTTAAFGASEFLSTTGVFLSTTGVVSGEFTHVDDAIYQLTGAEQSRQPGLESLAGYSARPDSLPASPSREGGEKEPAPATPSDSVDSPGQIIRLTGPETEIVAPYQRQEPTDSNSFEGEFLVELAPGVDSEQAASESGYTHEYHYDNLAQNLNIWRVDENTQPRQFANAVDQRANELEQEASERGFSLNAWRPSLAPVNERSQEAQDFSVSSLMRLPEVQDAYPVYYSTPTTTSFASDPLFPAQWHLLNTGQTGGVAGLDANVPAAWDLGVTGKGVTISFVDSGIQTTHPDLSPHVDALASYDFFDSDNDPSPTIGNGICSSAAGGTAECHGTAVAGVAAAVGNSIGVSGAAPNATIGASRLITGGSLFTTQIAEALDWNTTKGVGGSEYDGTRIDISNNSWGSTTDFVATSTATVIQDAITNSANDGRGGLGKIFVFAAGNGRTASANINYQSGLHNRRQVIGVAAAAHDGTIASYSNPGASLLITAPSNGQGEGITTTDLVTTDITSASRVDTPGYTRRDYTNDFGGTSSAAPLVSGVLALVLEANPNLTWRDVQHIVVNSASTTGLTAGSLSSFVANQSGRPFSHDFGFGIINAAGAVNLATNWQPVGPEVMVEGSASPGLAIPDNTGAEVTSTISISPDIQVETVEVVLNATHTFRGDLRITLEHAGVTTTASKLAEPRGNDSGNNYSNYLFTSRAHWGETSSGDWTLKIKDEAGGDVGTFTDWTLRINGAEIDQVNGPRVVQTEVSSDQLLEGQISTFQVQFDQPIDTGTFSSDDIAVTRIEGSTKTVLTTGAPVVVAGTNNTVFDVALSTAQTAAANYQFTIGSNISGANALLMDQNPHTAGNNTHTQFFQMGSRLMFSRTTAAGFSGSTLSEGGFSNNGPISVPTRTLTNLNVEDLNLRFDLFHAAPSRDLRLRLDSPHRTGDIVSSENASNSTVDSTATSSSFTNGYWDTVLDDESPNGFINATVNPNAYQFSDSYQPNSGTPLSLFDGAGSAGTWNFWVGDFNVDSHVPVLNDYTLIITPALTTPDVQIDSVTNFDGDNMIDVAYTIADDAIASSLTLGVFGSANGFFDFDSDPSTGSFVVNSTNCVAGSSCLSVGSHVASLNSSLFPTPAFTSNSPLYGVVVADPNQEILDPNRSNNEGFLTGVTKASGNALWVAGDPHTRNTVTITDSNVTFTNLNSGSAISYTSNNVDFIFANMGMLDDSVTASAVSSFNILAVLAEGSDTYTGGSLIDVVQGGPGDDNLTGNNGNDRLFGGLGVDTINGGAGNDLLSVGPGLNQTLDAGVDGDADRIVIGGTEFNDHVTVFDPDGNPNAISSSLTATVVSPVNPTGFTATQTLSVTITNVSATDVLFVGAGPGDDLIQLQSGGTPTLGTGVGNSIVGIDAFLGGGAGSDAIYAGKGSDQLFGDQFRSATVGAGDGNDILDARDGTEGNDVLWGAGGTDTLSSDANDTKNDG